ncbi:hypothetical protein E2P86_17650 [Sphingobacterium psychroaquaticum]|uniref:hypothetical protein n=1 Tax=Sphingobacterium psychroaquaticum TaxID=561061 RepID=UPI00106990FC|nr:hypothetical protein [Sphingobacterium psychroaquaticum]QBQ42864.1 hypothetical protein E2P86_17650 [Sphingobacterium psychroaquaticum]
MKHNRILACGALALALLASCKDSPDVPETVEKISTEYSVWVTSATGSYLLTTDNLMKDTLLTPVGNKGIDLSAYLPAAFYAVYAYNHEGKFYVSNNGTRFSQLEIQNNATLKETDNYAFPSNFFLGKVLKDVSTKDELVMTKTAGTFNEAKNVLEQPIYFMNLKDMTLNKTLNVDIPFLKYAPLKPDKTPYTNPYMVPTSITVRGNKLFVGHKYRGTDVSGSMDISDTTYVYVCDYPGLTNGKMLKDARGGFAAGHWEVQTLTFMDDNNDLYIVTKNRIASTYGLIRIKSGETEIDKDYFFDLKDYNVFKNSTAQVQKLGNGKAYLSPYVVDPANKKVIADLRILVGGGESKTTMNFMENGKLYDVFKTDASKWFVFEYDPATNSVKRGAEIDPGITHVYHVNKLK